MENKYSSTDSKLKIYLAYSVILLVLFIYAAYKAMKDRAMASVIAVTFVTSVFVEAFLICDLILRLCQTVISITDVDQQSRESFWSMAKDYFTLNTASVTIFVISTLLCFCLSITIRTCPLNYVWDFGPEVGLSMMIFSFCLLTRICNLADWEKRSLSDLSVMKGLDYGTGMAYSFYYGYLRLILPSTETGRKGIIEKIETFEANHNITFPVHKLFLLIPSSGYIPPDLKEASYQWMESTSNLEEEERNRAGNIGRIYLNSAYKIYLDGRNSGNDPVYAVVEGASPLLTYHEVLQHNHPESSVYKRYKSKIIERFYTKLLETLQSNPETRDLCELIYYNDYDANGDKVNVAKIILERISKIKKSA
ncbi:stimulator of interferon genes protein [Solenopsis invicta]|uniref:stimulator of interferon genes protein n=1 Tax=Solenopsis invicta TaxID=13686 RepID=UPI0001FEE723|nr:stimulator of interferon genes protein [Solenopsis invicta]XP_011169647.1 stimulator of interferon genes protein [Solenopsis invicta]XP_011169649.1 stimulator of interferon genes protein [Solenopsis invicta]XP_011169650.1 stimulator of interferon genes protein [Solenopsis invicta]XP_011169652.1 stimulator of interferon genes protein [Solenopsis invicta]XP_039311688.1 stimulator of interferon genes protein [Solenopsis invicta]XP_039311689.1 stimulator of interferon genes protein [Solenopsis